ncbi:HNH endonuclease [Shewanella surugensis]|uniref:HNH endonuclease n=1 Tax=Shewanella surugensis TaxID=212020 RepID=A0ABT0LFA3_9GAMM|nr:HNH endonuclease [Shewanella surugensis]MCL1126374.1 HNH endonuclease [Shewanella surugensis]
MIPDGIEKTHLELAIQEIIKDGIPVSRKSVHYDYLHGNKRYPPKYVISLAAKYAFGNELPPNDFNAVRARDDLRSRGHTVIDRRDGALDVIVSDDDESSFAEGKEKYRLHRSKERDSSITRKAKAARLEDTGTLPCDICDFDFYNKYGELGLGFIEAYHKVPVSELDGNTKTKISDLALVCSNCHRMLHRQKSTIHISELKKIIKSYAASV